MGVEQGPFFDRHWQPCRLRDEEWDQEPWVHEKHGGVRGGLGQGKEYAEREGRMGGGRGAWVVGVGQAGGHALGGAMGP